MIDVEVFRYDYKLDEPLSISYFTWYYRYNVIIKFNYRGFTGIGEAVPSEDITGDTQESVIEELRKIKSIDLNPEKDTLEDLHNYIEQIGIESHALRAALDFAYHDLVGQIKGVPVYRLYSNSIHRTPLSVTVFIKESEQKTYDETRRIMNLYPQLKVLKIKLKGEEDFQRCKAIKDAIGRNIVYTLDANQGYDDPEDATKSINDICDLLGDVLLVEEPCPKGELDKLKYVKDNVTNTLIFADESAIDLEDARKIIATNSAHGINIKLQKSGGIWPGKIIAAEADQYGLKVMTGAMIEGPLATSAGIHFSACTDNVILSDLDMDLDLLRHTDDFIEIIDGCRVPLAKPGLGLKFDMGEIRRLIEKEILVFERILSN